jgi:hypothetical protein
MNEQEDAGCYVDMACRDMQVKDWFHSFLVLLLLWKDEKEIVFSYVASQREHSINIHHILFIWSNKILENENAIINRKCELSLALDKKNECLTLYNKRIYKFNVLRF